jgi:7-alpha-hydroxysteroid dehydrogenase
MGRLDGRVAIVTGASRGLGRSIALAFAAEGAAIAVVARTEQVWDERLPGTIGETVAAIESAGGRAVAIRADLLADGDPARLVAEARSLLGPITILVNNAAFTAPGRPPKPGAAPVKEMKSATPSVKTTSASDGAGETVAKASWPTFVGTPLSAFRRHFEMNVFAAYELMQDSDRSSTSLRARRGCLGMVRTLIEVAACFLDMADRKRPWNTSPSAPLMTWPSAILP